MPLDFVTEIKSLDDGIINNLQGTMQKVRAEKKKVLALYDQIDSVLLDLEENPLPDLPSINDINSELALIETQANSDLFTMGDEVSNLAGSCLDGGLMAMNDMVQDAFGFVDDGMAALAGVALMPAQFLDLSGYLNEGKLLITSLGIPQFIEAAFGMLGCLADAELAQEVQDELDGITAELGLTSTGKVEAITYNAFMETKMNSIITDSLFVTALSEGINAVADQASTMSDSAATSLTGSIDDLKASIPKSPTPPSLF